MTKHTDFHSGKRKFIKGKLPLERKLDGFDFNKTKEHNINTNFLIKLESERKEYKPAYIKPVKKHLKYLHEGKMKTKISKIIRHHKTKTKEECIDKLQKILL